MYKKILLLLVIVLLAGGTVTAFDNFHGQKAAIEKFNYDSLYTAATSVEKSEAGQKLIEDCIAAYGGVEHLKNLSSCRIQYFMEVFLSAKDITVEKTYTNKRQYKIIRHQKPAIEARIIDGAKSWFIGRDTTLVLFSGKYKAELFSYLTLSMPLAMQTEPFSEMRYGTRNNDTLSYIYMKKNDSLMVVLGIDNKTHFIKYAEGVIYQDTNTFVFVNYFDNFKKVDGFVFPHSLENISMGLLVAKSVVTNIEINPILKENEFTPESVLMSSDKTH